MTEFERESYAWQKIEGAEKLHKIYGYYPTLHDANVLRVDCGFEKREICITFHYSDMVGNDVDIIASTLITLCWKKIVEADFSFNGNYLYGVELKFIDSLFETTFEESYFHGRILCEDIKVTEIVFEPDTAIWNNETLHTTKFSFK